MDVEAGIVHAVDARIKGFIENPKTHGCIRAENLEKEEF